jgi:hypothetical protein
MKERKMLSEHARQSDLKSRGNLSLADAFHLQKEDRISKGNRRKGLTDENGILSRSMRKENLTWETFDGVEETTERAVEELFERLRERRLGQDNASKSGVK